MKLDEFLEIIQTSVLDTYLIGSKEVKGEKKKKLCKVLGLNESTVEEIYYSETLLTFMSSKDYVSVMHIIGSGKCRLRVEVPEFNISVFSFSYSHLLFIKEILK